MVPCEPSALAELAKCQRCNSRAVLAMIRLYLLCRWAAKLNP